MSYKAWEVAGAFTHQKRVKPERKQDTSIPELHSMAELPQFVS